MLPSTSPVWFPLDAPCVESMHMQVQLVHIGCAPYPLRPGQVTTLMLHKIYVSCIVSQHKSGQVSTENNPGVHPGCNWTAVLSDSGKSSNNNFHPTRTLKLSPCAEVCVAHVVCFRPEISETFPRSAPVVTSTPLPFACSLRRAEGEGAREFYGNRPTGAAGRSVPSDPASPQSV